MSTYRNAARISAAMLAVGALTGGCGDILTLQVDPIVEVDRSTPTAPTTEPLEEGDVEQGDGGADASGVGATFGTSDAQPHEAGTEESCEATATCTRVVFVTSEQLEVDDLSRGGADAICTELAHDSGLSTRPFVAWVSTKDSPVVDRIRHHGGPYIRPDGMRVAASFEALTSGNLENAIEIDERKIRRYGAVWTGTTPDGRHTSPDCEGWRSVMGTGVRGRIGTRRDQWSASTVGDCYEPARIYCFEQ
jgi:hypothetical protein